MSTFSAAELLELDKETLYGLLEIAPGTTVVAKAAYLGLDCAIDEHYQAVWNAWPVETVPEEFSPPIGAGQDGVRFDLTPDEADPDDVEDDLELPPAPLEDAAAVAEALNRSIQTGEPFMGGTFAMYALPDGTVLVVTESAEGIQRRTIPKRIVRMALGAMMGGKKTGLLGRMMRG